MGLTPTSYAAAFITAFMSPEDKQRYDAYHRKQRDKYTRACESYPKDYGDIMLWLRAPIDRQKLSWREWLLALAYCTAPEDMIFRRIGHKQTKNNALLKLPTEILQMIFRLVLINPDTDNYDDVEHRQRVLLDSPTDIGKIQYSYLTQVCSHFRAQVTPLFFGDTIFKWSSNTHPAWDLSNEVFVYLQHSATGPISMIRYLDLEIKDEGLRADGTKGHFTENAILLEILKIFGQHGHLRKLKLCFSGRKQRLTRNFKQKPFVDLLKAVKVDEVYFQPHTDNQNILGGRKKGGFDLTPSINFKNEIERAIIRGRSF